MISLLRPLFLFLLFFFTAWITTSAFNKLFSRHSKVAHLHPDQAEEEEDLLLLHTVSNQQLPTLVLAQINSQITGVLLQVELVLLHHLLFHSVPHLRRLHHQTFSLMGGETHSRDKALYQRRQVHQRQQQTEQERRVLDPIQFLQNHQDYQEEAVLKIIIKKEEEE